MEKPIKFIKPKLKTKRHHKLHGPTMSIEEYEKITQPENLKFKSGCTSVDLNFLDKKHTKRISFYSGKVKNKKANGWGIEIITETFDPTILEYYEGEWKNGKRDGYGECYNYHPLIGPMQYEGDFSYTKPKMYEVKGFEEVYKGFWKKGKKVSK